MFNLKKLNKRLVMPTKAFANLGDTSYHSNHQLTYIDNNSDILAVCHLDTVLQATPKVVGSKVIAPQLDDRLGAYILLDVLPKLGLKYDILLCDAEEIGRSTARDFIPTKNYRWAFEFDRMGTDAVLYDYELNPKWVKAVSNYAKVGCGSFSDISDLTDWGFCAVNWGCGYHLQHTYKCFADLNDTRKMVKAFAEFYDRYKKVRFEYEAPSFYPTREDDWTNPHFDSYDHNFSYSTWFENYRRRK